MAPSPENNNTPKAPDKGGEKAKCDGRQESAPRNLQESGGSSSAVDGDSKEASVSCLDDCQLKALLDEAITYKSPKDRQGKSLLFNNLLTEAEDDLRNARATSASGPDIVRYCNTSARRHRNRKQPSSISENLTHGGSLNNLAKEELYEPASHLQRPKKTVSARQREGGSLPCNVNVGSSYDRQFFEETYRRREKHNQKPDYSAINMESDSLLEHDVLNQNSMESEMEVVPMIPRLPTKYTTNAKIEISGVDDRIPVPSLERSIKDTDTFRHLYETQQKYSLVAVNCQNFGGRKDDKKVDENCNAVSQSNLDAKKIKKGRKAVDKNVVVLESSQVMGHRSDIIDDVDKLIDYIDGNEEQSGSKSKSGVQKSHKLHKNLFDDGKGSSKKQRTRSKAKGSHLQKSNSLEEISTTKLEDFSFTQEEGKVALRPTKSNADRPRERRSWGNTEQIQLQNLQLYANASAENLETADFRVVTKKKKSKKRRSSLSGRRQAYSREAHVNDFNRVPSPEPRRKSAISVPHSEKSNDSSDVDSVHSLPIDTDRLNLDREDASFPISYADIAKTSNALERPKWNRPPGERKHERNGEKARVDKYASSESDSGKHEVTPERSQKAAKSSPELTPEPKSKNKQQTTAAATVQNVSQGVQTSPKLQNAAAVVVAEKVPVVAAEKVKNPPEAIYVSYIQNFPSIPTKEKSPVASLSETKCVAKGSQEGLVQNWPSITTPKPEKATAVKASPPNANQMVVQTTTNNNIKNIKNSAAAVTHRLQEHDVVVGSGVKVFNSINISEAQIVPHNNQPVTVYAYQNMPLNIPDVRTIEKMHFKQMQQQQQQQHHHHHHHHHQHHHQHNAYMPTSPPYIPEAIVNHHQQFVGGEVQFFPKDVPVVHYKMPAGGGARQDEQQQHVLAANAGVRQHAAEFKSARAEAVCDSERTTNRPAVVILSGNADKEVSGITFGFDINEQLLSDDVCADFLARFIAPNYCDVNGFNHDKIVNFIGIAWEDVVSESNGQVKYYSEEL